MSQATAKFSLGDIIQHRRFDYRGVIVDVDPTFQLSEEWYEQMATSRPPKDQPWYHVLVHGSAHGTYVAERNLESDDSGKPVNHPLVSQYFDKFVNGRYTTDRILI